MKLPEARRAALAGVIVLSALAAACFETRPVREQIDIFFHEDGAAEMAVTTDIEKDAYGEGNPRLRDRVSRLGGEIVRGDDPWSKGVRSAQPDRERRTYEFDKGNLTEAVLESLLTDPARFPILFEGFPVGAFLTREGSRLTLEFAPSDPSRASEKQERQVREATSEFAEALEAYLRDLAALYEHMDENPGRARPCFAKLLGIDDAEAGDSAGLSDEETAMADAVDKASDRLLGILTVRDGETHTLDELSQLVFDPFPGPLTVEVTGRVLSVEGFEQQDEVSFFIPEIGLWSALESLEDHWVSPLPVVEMVRAVRESESDDTDEPDDQAFLDDISTRTRDVAGLPAKAEILSALQNAMRPADTYRLEWRLPGGEPQEGSISAE